MKRPARQPHPYQDGPALEDPFIRGILLAFAMVAIAVGATIVFTPLLRFGLNPWWLGTFVIFQPLIGLLQKDL